MASFRLRDMPGWSIFLAAVRRLETLSVSERGSGGAFFLWLWGGGCGRPYNAARVDSSLLPAHSPASCPWPPVCADDAPPPHPCLSLSPRAGHRERGQRQASSWQEQGPGDACHLDAEALSGTDAVLDALASLGSHRRAMRSSVHAPGRLHIGGAAYFVWAYPPTGGSLHVEQCGEGAREWRRARVDLAQARLLARDAHEDGGEIPHGSARFSALYKVIH